eukprot:356679_1
MKILFIIVLFINIFHASMHGMTKKEQIRYLQGQIDNLYNNHEIQKSQFIYESNKMSIEFHNKIETISNKHEKEIHYLEQKLEESQENTQKMKEKLENDIQSMKSDAILQQIETKRIFLRLLVTAYNENNYNDEYLLLSEKYEKYSQIIVNETKRLSAF